MATLYVSRFLHLPHVLKPLFLFFNVLLIVALAKSPPLPAGSSLVWVSIFASLLVTVTLTIILLFELDTRIFPIKIITYDGMERGVSVTLGTFYFIDMWLVFGEAKLTPGGWFTTAAILCIALSATYFINLSLFFRKWLAEQRASRSQVSLSEDYS